RDLGPHAHRRRHRRPAGPGRQRPCPGQADPQSTARALPRRRACLPVPRRSALHVPDRNISYRPAQAPLSLAGKTWNSELKALNSDTKAQVAQTDQPFATALTKFDDQLLNFGATGPVGAAITTSVHADEHLIDDVL